MDIRQLKYFIGIVECGSLSKAAEHLHIAQPSLSQHVLNLEAELGVQLLNRSSRGVTVTEAGERLFEHAKNVMANLEFIKRDVKETSEGLTGNVVLGMPEKYATVLTVPIVERVERILPNISLRIIENMSGNLLEWLLVGKVHIAILIQVQRDPNLTIEPLVSERLYLVGSPRSELSQQREIAFKQLANLPLTLPSKEHGLRILAEEMAMSQSIRLTVKSEVDSIPAIKSLLRLSGSYSLLSKASCTRECKEGDLWAAPIIDPPITQTGVLAYSNRKPLAMPIKRIRDLIFDVVDASIAAGAWPGAVPSRAP
jgi:LysR family nitrogen assimilation transcriptional regulator